MREREEGSEGGIGREREREIQTDRQREIHRDRQRQTDRQTERQTNKGRDTETDRQIARNRYCFFLGFKVALNLIPRTNECCRSHDAELVRTL